MDESTTALQERIARALYEEDKRDAANAGLTFDSDAAWKWARDWTAVVLPIIARVEREAARRAINELIADKEHMTALLRAENGGEAEDVLAHFRDTLHPEETP